MCVEQANQNSFYQNIASNLLGTLSRSCRWCLSFRLGFGLSRSLGLTSGPFGRPYRAGVRSSRPLPLALMLSKKRHRGINIESTYDKDWRAEKGVKHGGQFQDRYPVYNEIKKHSWVVHRARGSSIRDSLHPGNTRRESMVTILGQSCT